MEASVAESRRPVRRRTRNEFSSALIRAKTQKRKVNLSLAIETDYTDHRGSCTADVMQVDENSTLFKIDGREIWILEAFLVSVEMLCGDSE